jgi:hypothetical protein
LLKRQASRIWVLKAIQQPSSNPERGGDDAACVTGMDPCSGHLDVQGTDDDPPKRRGQPKVVVVPRTGIEANDEAWGTNALAQRLEMRRKVR